MALSSSDDGTYTRLEKTIAGWTARRDAIAEPMKGLLEGAAFGGQTIDESQANDLIDQGWDLLDLVHDFTRSLSRSKSDPVSSDTGFD